MCGLGPGRAGLARCTCCGPRVVCLAACLFEVFGIFFQPSLHYTTPHCTAPRQRTIRHCITLHHKATANQWHVLQRCRAGSCGCGTCDAGDGHPYGSWWLQTRQPRCVTVSNFAGSDAAHLWLTDKHRFDAPHRTAAIFMFTANLPSKCLHCQLLSGAKSPPPAQSTVCHRFGRHNGPMCQIIGLSPHGPTSLVRLWQVGACTDRISGDEC